MEYSNLFYVEFIYNCVEFSFWRLVIRILIILLVSEFYGLYIFIFLCGIVVLFLFLCMYFMVVYILYNIIVVVLK